MTLGIEFDQNYVSNSRISNVRDAVYEYGVTNGEVPVISGLQDR